MLELAFLGSIDKKLTASHRRSGLNGMGCSRGSRHGSASLRRRAAFEVVRAKGVEGSNAGESRRAESARATSTVQVGEMERVDTCHPSDRSGASLLFRSK